MREQNFAEMNEIIGMKLAPLSIEVPVSDPIDMLPNRFRPMNRLLRRKRRSRPATERFHDLYAATGETLGEGSHGAVHVYTQRHNYNEYAVKVINKTFDYDRSKILKEIDIFHHCQGHANILQLNEYYEEDDKFYLVFDRLKGGSLFEHIQRRGHLTELEASCIISNLASALDFLHRKGIAHRDLKPENILCENEDKISPVRICDFDLGSAVVQQQDSPCTTPELLTPVGSAEYMAPEVVDAWVGDASHYDKKCDLWSLGIILYIMLCGYPPFYAKCGDNCGWEIGDSCDTCQDILFKRIQDGYFSFPELDWAHVSDSAKDLIRHLLKRNPRERYSAAEVLDHAWISGPAPDTVLATPRMLSRNNSSQMLLDRFAENAMACTRMMLTSLTISESMNSSSSNDSPNPFFSITPSQSSPAWSQDMFQIGSFSEDEDEDDNGRGIAIPVPQRPSCSGAEMLKLSPPASKLAERRKLRYNSTGLSPPSSASP